MPRTFDQWLMNTLLETPLNNPIKRGRYFLLRLIRRLKLIASDPVVTYVLGKYNLRVPLSHELPFYKKLFPEYAQNLGKLAFYMREKYPDLTMIDVGANVGDSVAIVRTFTDHPILCVEGEPHFFQLLKENTYNLQEIELEETFLGATGDQISGIRTGRGNAQIRLGPARRKANICTLSEALSRHPRFVDTKLLKLDAEGFDCRIISSEIDFISRIKPVLFFEYYPECSRIIGYDPFPVFSQLSELGYSTIIVYQNVGRYFMTVKLDQVDSLEDLHYFLLGLHGFCDVVAFHAEDWDIASKVRESECQGRAKPSHRSEEGIAA